MHNGTHTHKPQCVRVVCEAHSLVAYSKGSIPSASTGATGRALQSGVVKAPHCATRVANCCCGRDDSDGSKVRPCVRLVWAQCLVTLLQGRVWEGWVRRGRGGTQRMTPYTLTDKVDGATGSTRTNQRRKGRDGRGTVRKRAHRRARLPPDCHGHQMPVADPTWRNARQDSVRGCQGARPCVDHRPTV